MTHIKLLQGTTMVEVYPNRTPIKNNLQVRGWLPARAHPLLGLMQPSHLSTLLMPIHRPVRGCS